MMPLTVQEKEGKGKQCVAPVACALVKKLRAAAKLLGAKLQTGNVTNSSNLSGAGYYMLQPGTQLQVHAGPTNTRLTCHLTLKGGEGGWFFVGDAEPRQWEVGKAFCFDDSFLHHAVHNGTEPRYILLLDIPHPDMQSGAQ